LAFRSSLGFASLRGALPRALHLLALALTLGCAGDLVTVEGGFRHRQHGYSFGAPGGSWERTEVEGALIAFQRPGPQTMSVQSRCGQPVADVAIMARELVIGVSPRVLRQAGPVLFNARNAWTQTFDTLQGGVGVRVKTVTLVVDRCVLDWILAVAGSRPFEDAERAFDAWWQAFRLAPEAGPAEEGG
jgi:hypothetical protein